MSNEKQSQLKLLIAHGKSKGYLTYAEVNDTLPDDIPVLDRVPGLQGLVIATGLSGHGFGIGPAIGRVVADLVMERPVGHDVSAFSFNRFNSGQVLKPGLAF